MLGYSLTLAAGAMAPGSGNASSSFRIAHRRGRLVAESHLWRGVTELVLDLPDRRTYLSRHGGGGGPQVVVAQLGTANGRCGLLVGAAKAFVGDRSAVFVGEQQVIEAPLRPILVPDAELVEGVRQQVDRALRTAGLGIPQDDPPVPNAVVHLRHSLVNVELPLL